MRKLKVYLDTSVISHLLQDDVPEKMADTRQLWEMFKDGKYDVYLSTVTLREIEKCSEPKKTQLIDCLNEIQFTTLDITDDVVAMAEKIIDMGILTQKSFDDCQHIGSGETDRGEECLPTVEESWESVGTHDRAPLLGPHCSGA